MQETIPCILPGCNRRHYNNPRAQIIHMYTVHDIGRYRYTEEDKLFEYIKNNNYNEDCSLCHESLSNGDTIKHLPNCTHAFHTKCIDDWLKIKQTCPLCRKPTDHIDDPEVVQEQYTCLRRITNSNVKFIYIKVDQCVHTAQRTGRRCRCRPDSGRTRCRRHHEIHRRELLRPRPPLYPRR